MPEEICPNCAWPMTDHEDGLCPWPDDDPPDPEHIDGHDAP
jgi:hypothetical protein